MELILKHFVRWPVFIVQLGPFYNREQMKLCIHVFMDSYTTDFISSAKEISMHSPVSVCAIVRVVYISNFTLYLVLMLMVFSFSVFQKVIISIG